MAILVISDLSADSHVLPVTAELGRRGHEVRLFNPGAFPADATISVEGGSNRQRALLMTAGEKIDMCNIRSVWFRRPGAYRFAAELDPAEATWLRSEAVDLTQAIWANSDAFWVSEPRRLRQANLKLWQMAIAARLGFKVPPYLVTNDPVRARRFIAACPDGTVVKALTNPAVLLGDWAGMIYTHRVTTSELEQLDALRYGPAFFQAFVTKRYDVRVTVIGRTLFAVAIDPAGRADAQLDFRRAEIMDLPHTPIELPERLQAACLALTGELGLQFGAIDLLLTPDGEFQFLEINPNGQWMWIEMVTELPLTRAMADLLEQAGRQPIAPTRQPAARRPRTRRTLPVGRHRIPVADATASWPAADGHTTALAGTGVWFGRSNGRVNVHVGDVESG